MRQGFERRRDALALTLALAALAQTPRGVTVPPPIDPAAFLSQPKVALVVGIDNYPEDSGFTPLKFAANDARDLSRRLALEGYKTETLINEKAAGREIIKKLDDLLRVLDGTEGTVIFAFSGHGGQVKDSQYLALPDTRLSLLEETGLPLADVRKVLERSAAPRKVMFIDACRNDPAAKGPAAAAEAFGELGKSRGIAILNAAEPKQASFEDQTTQHGVFTNFLLRGFEGKAAGPNGLVTFAGLRDYVTLEMDRYSRITGRRQRPYQTFDGIGDFYLGGKWTAPVQPTIETIAGRDWRFRADGLPALSVDLGGGLGVAADRSGNTYVSDWKSHAVLKIDPAGIAHVLAGPDSAPPNRPFFPTALAVDSTGAVYFGENGWKVRKLLPSGETLLVAGGQKSGFSKDGSPAAGSPIGTVNGLALGADGTVFFSEWSNGRVRRIDSQGRLQTVAGNGRAGFSGDGGLARLASLAGPAGLAFDSGGNLFIADHDNGRIRRVDSYGGITTVAGPGRSEYDLGCPYGLTVNAKDELFFADNCKWHLFAVRNDRISILAETGQLNGKPSGIGGPATAASFDGSPLAVDRTGNLLVASGVYGHLYRIGADAKVSIVAGTGYWRATRDGTPARDAVFQELTRVAVDRAGNVILADSAGNRIYRIDSKQQVTTVAGLGNPGYNADGVLARESRVSAPLGLRARPDGSIVFADSGNHRVREISPDGRIRTLAGNGRSEYAGDGGPAVAASLNDPTNICFDAAGNLFIADTDNNRIRKVTRDGRIQLVAGDGMAGFSGDREPADRASLRGPKGIEIGPDGALYIADSGNRRIRRITADGIINTIAGGGGGGDGGPALRASFKTPDEVAFDSRGALYVRDSADARIRRIDLASGVITTYAGNGQLVATGDGGPANLAGIGLSHGFAIDAASNMYVTDEKSNRLRIIR